MQIKALAIATLVGIAALPAQALVITQWNFNASNLLPSIGSGTASLLGGTTSTFASGTANGGSSDGGTAWNVTSFAAQGTGNLSRGVQFSIDTTGYEQLSFSFDLRHSNTSARDEVVRVSVDNGQSFSTVASFIGNAGDTWFNGRSVDLSGVAGAANNSNLIVQVVAGFAAGGSSYLPSNAGSNYAASGTWRFDAVTLSGEVISVVPEPGTYALMFAGLGVVGLLARRRKA